MGKIKIDNKSKIESQKDILYKPGLIDLRLTLLSSEEYCKTEFSFDSMNL